MRSVVSVVALGVGILLAHGELTASSSEIRASGSDEVRATPAVPAALLGADDPEFYAIELVTTERVGGVADASGTAFVHFGTSPFGVSVSGDGSYAYDVRVEVAGLPERDGAFVAWVARTDLTEMRKIGSLDADGRAEGRVAWNKFLVIVTLETEASEEAEQWTGPVVLRGISRSGLMHTEAGHGPFEEAICMALAYDGCRSVR